MKKTAVLIGLFLCHLVFAGLGVNIAPGDIQKAKGEINRYLASENSSILQVYKDGKWQNWDGSGKENVYIISHGLNDVHDAKWITTTAQAMAKDTDAVILSVNWDHFSGTGRDDPNWLSSTWINAVSELVAEQLSGATIKHAVGHSYGAHLLADVISQANLKGQVGRFVGLDPAEEMGTLVSRSSIWDSSEVERFWKKAIDKTAEPVEIYKSSAVCGTDVPLGEYNFLLAGTGQISPKDLLGDWDGGGGNNHSLARTWYAETVSAKAAAAGDNAAKSMKDILGGWFNAEVEKGVDITDDAGNPMKDKAATGQGTWTGVVNADNKTKPLEYILPETAATGNWGDVFTAMGRNTSDWNGTVLNPKQKQRFDSQFEPQTWKDTNGDVWEYDPKTGKTTVNGKATTGASGLGTNWETSTPGGNINSISDYLDGVIKDAESAGKDVLNDALEAFKTTWKSSTGSIWDRLKDSVKGGIQGAINSIKGNLHALITKYTSLAELEKIANWGLNKLLELNPTLKTIFTNLGLNNINNLIGLGKDIFNLVKGLLNGGSFLTLLRNSTFLTNVLKNALNWGLNVLKNFLSGLITKFLGKLVDKISNFVKKVLGAFGINIQIDFQNLLKKGVDAALNAGATWVKVKVDTFLSPAGQTSKKPAKSKIGKQVLKFSK
ncbi:MAG: hypothetical protein IKO93_24005 [Lentisphaeria bacterium]|nr:hypothetical protein [Lentisphaeria bacterium]